MEPAARRLYRLVEPIHLVTYFSGEPTEALMALGHRNYRDGYFAGQAAPLGSLIAGTCVGRVPGFRLSLAKGVAAMRLADRCQYAASRARSPAANATGLRAPASQSTVTTLASAAVTPAGVRIVSRVVRLVVPTRSTSIRTCS